MAEARERCVLLLTSVVPKLRLLHCPKVFMGRVSWVCIVHKHVCAEYVCVYNTKCPQIGCIEEKAQHRLLISLNKFNATKKKMAQLNNQIKYFQDKKQQRKPRVQRTESSLSQSIILILRLPILKDSEEFLIYYSKTIWHIENRSVVFLLVDPSPVKQFSFFSV